MRAAVLHECPGWLDITDLEVGSIGPHEVLVHTNAAGLCHSDLHCIEGTLPIGVPTVLGHESSGVVEAVGADVTDFRPGDEVIACTSAACGLCPTCTTGRPHMCQNRPTRTAGLGPALAENGVPGRPVRGRRRVRRADAPSRAGAVEDRRQGAGRRRRARRAARSPPVSARCSTPRRFRPARRSRSSAAAASA